MVVKDEEKEAKREKQNEKIVRLKTKTGTGGLE